MRKIAPWLGFGCLMPTLVIAAPLAYQNAVVADSPYVYYRMGEASGTTAADMSGNSRSGIYVNSPTLGAAGFNGGDTAVMLNGTSQYVSAPNITAFGPQMTNASFEFVFKATGTAAQALAGTFNTGSTTAFIVSLNENSGGGNVANSIRLYIRDGSGTQLGAAFVNAGAFDGNYHHLVYTYNSSLNTNSGTGGVHAYLDGVEQALSYGPTGTPANFANFGFAPAFGARNVRGTIGQYVNGTLDEAALYTHVLTPATVFNHYYNALLGLTNLHWAVADGTWDINTTANWSSGAGLVNYQEINGIGDQVLFDDTASGASPISVTLDSTVSPFSITNNSSKNYTISGSGGIAGSGSITKSGSGTLTLSTYNSFTGPVKLNAGTLALGTSGAALGQSASLVFNGGTLLWSSGAAEDISSQPVSPFFPRTVTFNAAAVLDTGNNSVGLYYPIGNGGSGGLVKAGAGTLTLAQGGGDNNYSGNTVVSNGVLVLSSGASISNSPAIIVNSGATFDASSTGLTLGSGSALNVLAGNGAFNGAVINNGGVITPGTNGLVGTLTFNNDLTLNGGSIPMDVSTASSDLIAVGGNLSLYGGALKLNITGTLTNGIYKLIQYSGSLLSGSGSSGTLVVSGFAQSGQYAYLNDSTSGEIDLVVIPGSSDSLTWGNGSNGSTWDLAGTPDWLNGGSTPWAFTNGDSVTFDDTGTPTVNLQSVLIPGSVTVNNSSQDYTFADGTGVGGGKLTGSAGITKSGTGMLTIATANDNSGPTVINGGTVQVGNGGPYGDLGSGNVANNGALVFNQSGDHLVSGSVSGTGGVTQQGSGTVTLAADNTYAGATIISSGTLQIGNGGATGTLGASASSITDNGGLAFNRSGTLTVANQIVGTGSLAFSGGGTFTISGANSYSGGTVINSGKLIMANAAALGSAANLDVELGGTNDLNGHDLTINSLNSTTSGGRIVNDSGTGTNVLTINYDGSGTADSSVAINDNDGTGGKVALVKTGVGEQILRIPSAYSGGTIVSNGTLTIMSSYALGTSKVYLRGGNLGCAALGGMTNDIQFDVDGSMIAKGTGDRHFGGNITANNLTVDMSGDPVTRDTWYWNGSATQLDGVTGTISVTSDGPDYFSFQSTDLGSVSPTIALNGSAILHSAAVGTFQVGALTSASSSTVLFGASGSTWVVGGKNLSTTFSGYLSGTLSGVPGQSVNNSLIKVGTGALTFNGQNYFTGSLTVSNGMLVAQDPFNCDNFSTISLASAAAKLDVSGSSSGTLNLGNVKPQTLNGIGTVNGSVYEYGGSTVNVGLGTLNVTNVATLNGALIMQLNRTNSVNASKLTAGSLINNSALTVTNVGPALQGGDTFQLFSGAVTGFTATNLPALTSGLYWTNKLALNGSVAVISTLNTNPPVMGAIYSGGVLTLSWPTNAGWTLQMQTNSLAAGLGTNWVDVPGSTSITSTNITVDPTKPTVFYRLANP